MKRDSLIIMFIIMSMSENVQKQLSEDESSNKRGKKI